MYGERSSRHRGARRVLAAAVFVLWGAGGAVGERASASGPASSPADSALVILTVGVGAQWVDLPRFAEPTETVGWRPQAAFAFGVVPRRWCEPFAELSYAYLPGPDSVFVASTNDTVFADMGTLTQVQAGVLLRPFATRSLMPYARLAAGIARLSVASPGSFDERGTDALWSAGGGVEWWAHRHLVVRAEARYTGQAEAEAVRSHFALQLALGYVFHRSMLAVQ